MSITEQSNSRQGFRFFIIAAALVVILLPVGGGLVGTSLINALIAEKENTRKEYA